MSTGENGLYPGAHLRWSGFCERATWKADT